jgi:hypothetical protein
MTSKSTRPAAQIPTWKTCARWAVLPFIVSRVICATGAYIGSSSLTTSHASDAAGTLLRPWTAFDGAEFIAIAQHGYTPRSAAFFPMYPAALRLAGTDANALAACGILLSTLAFFAALVVIGKLVARDLNLATARRTVWVLALLPPTFIFSAVYSDSLFLLLLATTWYLWASGQIWRAAAAGLLLGLTRNTGVVVTLALAVSAWQSGRTRGMLATFPAIIAPVLGLILFQGYLAIHFGNPLVGVNAHEDFGRALMPPWQPVIEDAQAFLTFQPISVGVIVNFIPIALAVWLPYRYRHRLPVSYSVLLLGVIAMELVYSRTYVPHLNGTFRFLAMLFPFAELAALFSMRWTRSRSPVIFWALALSQAVLCFTFAEAWGRNLFISG